MAEGAGTFNLATNTVTYAQNIYEKLYPASTTKILTAYIALKYGNLEDYVTVSENAADQASDSSVCGLKAGDVVQLKDLLYGMMLKSGNDAAIAIAEHIGGSVEGFADMMNQEARAMGATRSHFVNQTDFRMKTTIPPFMISTLFSRMQCRIRRFSISSVR